MSKSREELTQQLVERMHSVTKEIRTGFDFPFGTFMLNFPQIRILFTVAHKKEPPSIKELAETLKVTSGAVTQFIDVLVEKGLVKREEDPRDRRILRIKLTELAEDKFARLHKDYFTAASRAFDKLGDEEVQQLILLLDKVLSGAKERSTK